MTNADKLRSLTDQDLAEWLNLFKQTTLATDKIGMEFTEICSLDWLQSQYKPRLG